MFSYLRLVRFPLVLTAVADSFAGVVVATGGAVDLRLLPVLAFISATLYCFGMGSNDLADRERDREIHPDRVLPSGVISVTSASVFLFILLLLSAGGVYALSWLGVQEGSLGTRFGVWGAIVGLIFLYNYGGKKLQGVGPLFMGLVRGGNFLLGVVVVSGVSGNVGVLAGMNVLYVLFITLVSTLEEGAPKKGLFVVAAGGLLAAVAGSALVGWLAWGFSLPGLLGSVLLVGWLLSRIKGVLGDFERGTVMKLVRDGVMGIILLDASIVLWSGEFLYGAVIAGFLLPSFLLLRFFQRAAHR